MKNTLIFDYSIGAVFTIGIMIYLYLLIKDKQINKQFNKQFNKQTEPNKSKSEIAWIYVFLCILIIGFFLSYYNVIAICN
jgi:hypothetical protein